MQDLLRGGLTRLACEGRQDQGNGTSRGFCDASHDDWSQAGANVRSVLVSSLVLKEQEQARRPGA